MVHSNSSLARGAGRSDLTDLALQEFAPQSNSLFVIPRETRNLSKNKRFLVSLGMTITVKEQIPEEPQIYQRTPMLQKTTCLNHQLKLSTRLIPSYATHVSLCVTC